MSQQVHVQSNLSIKVHKEEKHRRSSVNQWPPSEFSPRSAQFQSSSSSEGQNQFSWWFSEVLCCEDRNTWAATLLLYLPPPSVCPHPRVSNSSSLASFSVCVFFGEFHCFSSRVTLLPDNQQLDPQTQTSSSPGSTLDSAGPADRRRDDCWGFNWSYSCKRISVETLPMFSYLWRLIIVESQNCNPHLSIMWPSAAPGPLNNSQPNICCWCDAGSIIGQNAICLCSNCCHTVSELQLQLIQRFQHCLYKEPTHVHRYTGTIMLALYTTRMDFK